MKLKIESDTTDEVNLNKAVKKGDLNPVSAKINKIIQKAEKIIKFQLIDQKVENQTSEIQIQYNKNFFILTVIQIFIIIIVGLYHIYSFRKFLLRNYIVSYD